MTAEVAGQRILRGVTAALSWQNLDGDGAATAPAGAVTVGVVNAAGATVVASGTATAGTGADPRTYSLAASGNSALTVLTATWTDAGDASTHVTTIEVVGGFLFTIAEAREADAVLANDEKWSDAAVIATRRQIEDEFERICDVAFVPRYRREVLNGAGRSWLTLAQPRVRTVRSITERSSGGTTTAWTAAELADLVAVDDGSVVTSRSGKGFPSVDLVVEYEHGYSSPPSEVKRAAFQRLRYLLAQSRSGIPDRATSFSVIDGGSYRLDTAGKFKTGQPDVDAVLQRWSHRSIGVA